MSTPNFRGNDYFNDYAYVYTMPSEEDIKAYEEENDCKYDYVDNSSFDYDCEYDNMKYLIPIALEKFNISLFNVEVHSGYYDGLELIVTSAISGLEVEDITNTENLKENYDNEDMRYYFGHLAEYKSQIIPKIKAEMKRMNEEVLPYLADNSGFKRINCVAIFSNGEAIYEWAK